MCKRINEDEQERSSLTQRKLLTKVSLQKNFYHVWLTSEIESADKYVDVFDCLMQATAGDVVAFHLNTPGGDLNTALQIIDAIESTPATTIGFLEGEVCSAGSMIAMACENVEISEYAQMMIHTFTQGMWGKFSDIQTSTDFHTKWWKEVFEKIYKDFCTKEEMAQILAGKELWLNATQCAERFKHRYDIRTTQSTKSIDKKQNGLNKITEIVKKYNIKLPEIASAITAIE